MSHEDDGKANTTQVNNMFLIGAGFTRAVFQKNAPLNADVLPFVVRDNPKTLLTRYRIRYHTDDIEVLLTRLDLEMLELKSEYLSNDRESINRDLVAYFEQFRFTEQVLHSNQWLEAFANDVFHGQDAIITLNYDSFLEALLDHFQVWTPNKGYAILNDFLSSCPENPKGVLIYKLHGSVYLKEASSYPDKEKTKLCQPINESIFPHSGRNSFIECGSPELGVRPYIIPPSFIKSPHYDIERMMIQALQAAGCARSLVIIGCSLRPEDSFLQLLLTNFLHQLNPGKKKMLKIVDPDAQEIRDRIVKHCPYDISEYVDIRLIENELQKNNVVQEILKELENSINL